MEVQENDRTEKKVSPIKIKITPEGEYYIDNKKRKDISKRKKRPCNCTNLNKETEEIETVAIEPMAVTEIDAPEVIVISDDEDCSIIPPNSEFLVQDRTDVELMVEEDLYRSLNRILKIQQQIKILSELLFILISAEKVCLVRIKKSEQVSDELVSKERFLATDKYESVVEEYGKRFTDGFSQLEKEVTNTQEHPRFTYCQLLHQLYINVKEVPSDLDVTVSEVKKVIVRLLNKNKCLSRACSIYEEAEENFVKAFEFSVQCFNDPNYHVFGLYGPSNHSSYFLARRTIYSSLTTGLQPQQPPQLQMGPQRQSLLLSQV